MSSHNTDGQPCRHMESLLQDVAEGRAKGLRKLYAVSHAARCYRCGNFLERMGRMLQVMRNQKQDVPDDAVSRLTEKFGGSDKSSGPG